MPDSVNLFELVAKVEADFRQSDRAIDTNERKVQRLIIHYRDLDRQTKTTSASSTKFGSTISGLGQGISGLGGPLGNVTTRIAGLTSSLGGMTSAAGPAGIAIGVIATATVAAAAGVFTLTTAMAEQTGKFVDLSQQTGFQVETLSALNNMLETSGGNLDSASNALFFFETKMGEARDQTSEMSKVFKVLNIDTHDNEVALRQALDALLKMNDAEVKATLGKKLFGRSVKDILGALAEAGSLDAFLNKQLAEGTLITSRAAKQGDELSDTMVLLRRQFLAAGRGIAEEFTPMVTDGLRTFSRWLQDNQVEIKNTAKEIVKLIGDITSLANLIYSISPLRLVVEIVRKVTEVLDNGRPKYGDQSVQRGMGSQSVFDRFRDWMDRGPVTSPGDSLGRVDMSKVKPQTADQIAATRKANEDAKRAEDSQRAEAKRLQDRINGLLSGGGGGGGGRGTKYDPTADRKRLTDLQLQLTLETNRREESDIERSYDQRRMTITVFQRAISRLEEERHKATLEKLTIEREEIEKNPKLNQLQKAVALQDLEVQRAREMNRHREEENQLQDKINRATRERIVLTETLIKLQTRGRFSSDVILHDLGGGSVQVDEDTRGGTTRPRRVADATRPRIATEAEQRRREEFAEHVQRIRDLASDLTFTIDDAIRAGFEGGIGHGIKAFGLGILEMARHSALKALEKAMANALLGGDELNQQGKGNWLTRLLGIAIGAVTGGIGGFGGGSGSAGGAGSAAAGAIGKFAQGGFMRPDQWAWVGERGPELIKAGPQGATVMSNEKSTANQPIINMNVYAQDARSFARRETQTQIKNRMVRELRIR